MNNKKFLEKTLYKTFLVIVKYLPITLLLLQLLGTILNNFGICSPIITCLGGTSIIFILLLWLLAYVFRFCYLYKIPLIGITLVILITSIDSFVSIPVNTLILYRILYVIFGISIISFITYTQKCNKKDNITEFCEKVCK